MKNLRLLFLCFLTSLILISCGKKEMPFQKLVNDQLEFSTSQYLKMFDLTKDSLTLPRSYSKEGKLVMAPSDWWTSGFVPGTLWYL